MTGRILSFAKSPHQSAQELLPWFLNGTLGADESAQVEQHMRSCAACRSELQCLRELQSAYVESDLAPEAGAALGRLLPRLDPVVPDDRRRASAPRAAWLGLFPAGAPWSGLFPVWIKIALAAQFGVIFALGWAVVQPDRAGSQYHLLAAAGSPAHAAGDLVVVFDPAAPQREVTRILRASGVRVVDGPTASNGLVLAVPKGHLQPVLTSLRAEPLVVLAAPLEAETSP
jgi:anti-sigma factor RsiW